MPPYCDESNCFQYGSTCPGCHRVLCLWCSSQPSHAKCASPVVTFSWTSLFPALERADGHEKHVQETLARAEVVGVYFSAHWCPPCRGFTPKLAEIYNSLQAAGKQIEIVFVSSDSDEEEFRSYHSSMPWLALPYRYRAEKGTLNKKYDIQGIPTLVLLSKTGEVITADGVEVLLNWGAEGFPFTQAYLTQLEISRDAKRKELLRECMGNGFQIFGEALMADGSTTSLKATKDNKVIALLFGDTTNHGFANYVGPVISKVYTQVRDRYGADALEVLYIPWAVEHNEEAEQTLRASFPFPSVKPSTITSEVRKLLEGIFGTINSPTIALVSGDAQEILNSNAVREIYESKADGYPWTTEALAQLDQKKAQALEQMRAKLTNFQLFDNLLVRGKESVAVSSVAGNQMVGLYFSAHWCGPCKAFTPVLASLYEELKAQGKKFEIIFISSDENEAAFEHYYESMPWLALNYSERDLKNQLSELFEVRGIPTLILLDGAGNTITNNGRMTISAGAEFFPWGVEEMKNYQEVKQLRAAEARAKALAQEESLAEEQRARGNGVLARLRGTPGVSACTADHEIHFNAFDTIGAPSNAISRGSFFYEIEIVSLEQGLTQFGWADADFKRSDEAVHEGTGDDEDSFAADGSRVQRWHGGDSFDFGQPWSDGDVIGCAANLDEGTLLFGLNGSWEEPMGVAFEGIAPTGGLYPSLTASNGTFRVNLGGRPFKFGPPNATFSAVVVK